jgi:hypothetical protein
MFDFMNPLRPRREADGSADAEVVLARSYGTYQPPLLALRYGKGENRFKLDGHCKVTSIKL